MKDFLLANVAVIWADTPKSARERKQASEGNIRTAEQVRNARGQSDGGGKSRRDDVGENPKRSVFGLVKQNVRRDLIPSGSSHPV